ncbi:replication initiator protein A [Streptococcus infantis SK970]|nr:replication initiator protein A [Streptococcus infantis SK970]
MADITIDQLATLTFYQIPEIFFTRIQYNENGYVKLTSSYTDLSSDAKLAYGALYNRCKLSISSFQKGNRDYVDENGAVFLIFTVSDLMLLLDKGKMKVTKIKKELQEHGLLREVRQGLNKPNRLYLQLVDANLEIVEHYSIDGELLKRTDAFGKVLYEKECDIEKHQNPSVIAEVHKTDVHKTDFKTSIKRTE